MSWWCRIWCLCLEKGLLKKGFSLTMLKHQIACSWFVLVKTTYECPCSAVWRVEFKKLNLVKEVLRRSREHYNDRKHKKLPISEKLSPACGWTSVVHEITQWWWLTFLIVVIECERKLWVLIYHFLSTSTMKCRSQWTYHTVEASLSYLGLCKGKSWQYSVAEWFRH